jgi:hypothetical protein
MILKIMDIIRFALAIIVALTMVSVFLLLVKNDLKKRKKSIANGYNPRWWSSPQKVDTKLSYKFKTFILIGG